MDKNSSHPGYYWKAYEWANLFPSCQRCNRRSKVPPWLSGSTGVTISGKGSSFPLAKGSRRACKPLDSLSSEDPLLLNPCVDKPIEHLGYLPSGEVFGLNGSLKGSTTCDIFELNLTHHVNKRGQIIRHLVGLLRLSRKLRDSGNLQDAQELRDLASIFAEDCREYAGAAKYMLANEANFLG